MSARTRSARSARSTAQHDENAWYVRLGTPQREATAATGPLGPYTRQEADIVAESLAANVLALYPELQVRRSPGAGPADALVVHDGAEVHAVVLIVQPLGPDPTRHDVTRHDVQ